MIKNGTNTQRKSNIKQNKHPTKQIVRITIVTPHSRIVASSKNEKDNRKKEQTSTQAQTSNKR